MKNKQRFRIAMLIIIVLSFIECKQQNPPLQRDKPQAQNDKSQEQIDETDLHYEVIRKEQSTTGKYYYEVSAKMGKPTSLSLKRDVHGCQLTIYESSTNKILEQFTHEQNDIPCEMADLYYASGWIDDDTISMQTYAIGAAETQYTLYYFNWHSKDKQKMGWVSESPHDLSQVGGIAFALIKDRRFLVQFNTSKELFQIFEHKIRKKEGTFDFFSEKDQTVDTQKSFEVASFAGDQKAKYSVDIDDGHLIIKVGDEIFSYDVQAKTLERK